MDIETIEEMKLQPGQGVMAVMDQTGDTKLIWNRDNADEVENARRTFKDLVKKGYTAFHVKGKEGAAGEKMNDFDPDAERIILSPKMQGG